MGRTGAAVASSSSIEPFFRFHALLNADRMYRRNRFNEHLVLLHLLQPSEVCLKYKALHRCGGNHIFADPTRNDYFYNQVLSVEIFSRRLFQLCGHAFGSLKSSSSTTNYCASANTSQAEEVDQPTAVCRNEV